MRPPSISTFSAELDEFSEPLADGLGEDGWLVRGNAGPARTSRWTSSTEVVESFAKVDARLERI